MGNVGCNNENMGIHNIVHIKVGVWCHEAWIYCGGVSTAVNLLLPISVLPIANGNQPAFSFMFFYRSEAWNFSPDRQIEKICKSCQNKMVLVGIGQHDSPEFRRQSNEFAQVRY